MISKSTNRTGDGRYYFLKFKVVILCFTIFNISFINFIFQFAFFFNSIIHPEWVFIIKRKNFIDEKVCENISKDFINERHLLMSRFAMEEIFPFHFLVTFECFQFLLYCNPMRNNWMAEVTQYLDLICNEQLDNDNFGALRDGLLNQQLD